MCAGSDAKIGKVKIDVYMGHDGGNISIDDLTYDVDGKGATRGELVARLLKFKKKELATLIADLIDNSLE